MVFDKFLFSADGQDIWTVAMGDHGRIGVREDVEISFQCTDAMRCAEDHASLIQTQRGASDADATQCATDYCGCNAMCKTRT